MASLVSCKLSLEAGDLVLCKCEMFTISPENEIQDAGPVEHLG